MAEGSDIDSVIAGGVDDGLASPLLVVTLGLTDALLGCL
jgi:hypothetical protein